MTLPVVRETDEAYVVEIETPGVKRREVTAELAGRELTVRGGCTRRRGLFRRRTGEFTYRVTLPDEVDADRVTASLVKGMLTVRVPKSVWARKRRIAISAA
ncbi:Hsp20/alpha crystallin family protein [Amycolatopsis australiensis]|uniref:Hsp20/alpha crystallin family protein n=1 Tax=Amycolatopsis australiensis TaxID=546364 RepID=UPI001161386C|nr:Hsp20/alpha crystallin family protein [Amycolatopsis australiensis]